MYLRSASSHQPRRPAMPAFWFTRAKIYIFEFSLLAKHVLPASHAQTRKHLDSGSMRASLRFREPEPTPETIRVRAAPSLSGKVLLGKDGSLTLRGRTEARAASESSQPRRSRKHLDLDLDEGGDRQAQPLALLDGRVEALDDRHHTQVRRAEPDAKTHSRHKPESALTQLHSTSSAFMPF
eukprot:3003527-Rhodomonas_salina.3